MTFFSHARRENGSRSTRTTSGCSFLAAKSKAVSPDLLFRATSAWFRIKYPWICDCLGEQRIVCCNFVRLDIQNGSPKVSVSIFSWVLQLKQTGGLRRKTTYIYIWTIYIDIAYKHIPSTNQTWQRKIPYRLRWFSDKKNPSIVGFQIAMFDDRRVYYPLVICYIAIEAMAIESSLTFPWIPEVIFHSYVSLPEGI